MLEQVYSMERVLKEKRDNISNLKLQIDNLPEVIKLRKIEQEEKELEKKIINCSIYDIKLIEKTLISLMNIYEGIEYNLESSPSLLYDYYLCPKDHDNEYRYFYSCLGIVKIRNIIDRGKEICYLPSSNFNIVTKYQEYETKIKISYIQKFIDFLNEQRFINDNNNIDEIFMEKCLQDFVSNSKSAQIERKNEIKKDIKEYNERKERLKFEETCLIERTVIYNAFSHIINEYDDEFTATQTIDSLSDDWIVTEVEHILTIRNNYHVAAFRTEIDPYNQDKETRIQFFKFKNSFDSLLNNNSLAKYFLNTIAEMFLEGKEVNKDDIEELVQSIKSKRGRTKLLTRGG